MNRFPRSTQRLSLLTTALCCLAGSSCSGTVERPNAPVHLDGMGATFPAVLYHEWFEAFNKKHPEIHVEYTATGSMAGAEGFIKEQPETLDFAASDNGLTLEEVAQVKRGVLQVPVAAGLIAIVYNLPGIDNLKLSRAACTGIFLGTITRWNDKLIADANPGVELPNKEITPIVRKDGSGTTFLFTNHLAAVSPEWRDKHGNTGKRLVSWPTRFLQWNGNEAVGGRVKLTQGSIGYVDLGTVQAGQLRAALLENRQGQHVEANGRHATLALQHLKGVVNRPVFLPDPDGHDDYPIVGFTYLMVYRKYPDAAKLDAIKKLLRWCLEDEGQDYCARLGYVRLPASLATEAIKAVQSLGSQGE